MNDRDVRYRPRRREAQMERALCTESERGPMLREVSGDGRVLEKSQKKPRRQGSASVKVKRRAERGRVRYIE